MERILRERDLLLGRATRLLGLAGCLVAGIAVLLPHSVPLSWIPVLVPAVALTAVLLFRVGSDPRTVWLVAVYASVVGGMVLVFLSVGGALTPGAAAAVSALTGGAGASLALSLARSGRTFVLLIAAFAGIGTVAVVIGLPTQRSHLLFAFALATWLYCTVIGVWLSRSMPPLMRRIVQVGNAHRAEREASEREAQRRQGARLLHDTVLATLTMLAHSGVGVSGDALRLQAADDAQLLRQLRLGASPSPRASGLYKLETTAETPLGTSLGTVRERFARMGLTVRWHGSGTLPLDAAVLDPFLLALSECLENVRRHSGVLEADVTITHDERSVRAMITDTGVGFDSSAIGEGSLGFQESVVARLREVGGTARVFSSPGAGTTVVLEVTP